jgi:hypothetical protein
LLLVHQSLAPWFATIDGKDPPAAFYEKFTSNIVQSPLSANLTILASSCYQAAAQGLTVGKCVEAIAIEGRVISLIIETLKKHGKNIDDETIRTVLYLTMHEAR